VTLPFLAALEENPPPTLRELADRLGYKKARSLRKRCPELTKLLTTKRRASFPVVRRRSRKKEHDDAGLKFALKKALEEEMPPPLDVLAESLGYSEARPLRRKFKSLCDSIVARRAEYWTEHTNGLRIKLKAILLEDPPPPLIQVTKRLGYRSNASLSKCYPELCSEISTRHAKYSKTKVENIRPELQAALCEEPPPSLRAAASRLGYTQPFLRRYFPKASQEIVIRYARFRRESSLERKKQAKTRIRRLAMDLHLRGTYPSADQLRKASNGPTGLDRSELCAVLRDVRREVGLLQPV
jgi:DNA-binding Lrp family transcriptional regulator